MRICITRSEQYSYSETFIRDQITGFSKLAEVFTIHSGRLPERSEDGTLLNSKFYWILHKVVKTVTGKRNNYFGNYGLKKYFRENKIDVVLANYGLAGAHLMPICRDLGIPLLVIFHGHDATDKKLLRSYESKYRQLFGYAIIITVSQEMKSRLVAMGADANKVEVVSCGVDVLKFKPIQTKKENLFLAVGRFVAKKGPLNTIKAFYQVWKKNPEAKLMMIGKKSGLQEECEELVAEFGMQEAVIFPGILKQEEISDLMHRALAFVQHSVTAPNGDMEGTPVSILEASASALPVVSTLHGGIKDAIVHEKTGFLVKEGDIDGMAKYMSKLLADHKLAEALGKAGRQHITENYAQDTQIRKLFNLALKAVRRF